MKWLPTVALLLIVLWAAARAFGWVLGAALNLLWIAAVLLFLVWALQALRRP